MSAFARVARIAKTRNLEGSVVANGADGLPFLLCEGMKVHFVPPTLRGPRAASVAQIKYLKEDAYEVFFDGIESIDEAEKIVDCYCLARKEDLPELDVFDVPQRLIGHSVVDGNFGELGVVADVLVNSAQAVLVVEGNHGEVMIPIVDEFVVDFDEEQEAIFVSIPESLLTLN